MSSINMSSINITAASNAARFIAQNASRLRDPDLSADDLMAILGPFVLKIFGSAILVFWATVFLIWYLYSYHKRLSRGIWACLRWWGYVVLLLRVLQDAQWEVARSPGRESPKPPVFESIALAAELAFALTRLRPLSMRRIGIFVGISLVFLLVGSPVTLLPTFVVSSWKFLSGQGWSLPKTRDLWAGIGLMWSIFAIIFLTM